MTHFFLLEWRIQVELDKMTFVKNYQSQGVMIIRNRQHDLLLSFSHFLMDDKLEDRPRSFNFNKFSYRTFDNIKLTKK